MNTWIVGDLHGCEDTFAALRQTIDFRPQQDRFVFVGDLINRGPKSLETLRWIVQHQDCVSTVLGNHDIHLLWCALGAGMPKGRDTLYDILHAPDAPELIEWLRKQPFTLRLEDALVVHAGLHPTWTVDDALTWSDRLSSILQGPNAGRFLDRLRAGLNDDLADRDAFHAMNVLTRMRTLEVGTHALDLRYSGTLDDLPVNLLPWFEIESEHPRPAQVFFGHWAALHAHVATPYICLDSGCVWGRGLTAWHLETGARVYQPAIDEAPVLKDGQRRPDRTHFRKL